MSHISAANVPVFQLAASPKYKRNLHQQQQSEQINCTKRRRSKWPCELLYAQYPLWAVLFQIQGLCTLQNLWLWHCVRSFDSFHSRTPTETSSNSILSSFEGRVNLPDALPTARCQRNEERARSWLRKGCRKEPSKRFGETKQARKRMSANVPVFSTNVGRKLTAECT